MIRPSIILLFIIATIAGCSEKKKEEAPKYAPKGSLLVFDSLARKYTISSADQKLITTWESFTQAAVRSDYRTMRSLSMDSIVCGQCPDFGNSNTMNADTFYAKHAENIFSERFNLLLRDSSKIRCSYETGSMYFNAHVFLRMNSYLEKPRIAEMYVSFPNADSEEEGKTGILVFVETKDGYKFFEYMTIP